MNSATTPDAHRRGHPILGAVSGLIFGLFLGIDAILFGLIPLDSAAIYLFPVLGIALGIGLAMWAPFNRTSSVSDSPDATSDVAATSAADVDAQVTSTDGTATNGSTISDAANGEGPTDDQGESASTTSGGA